MSLFPRTVMLLGSGELGKEVVIAAQRLGCRVIACDRYGGAPAMQVADQAEVLPMTDAQALLEVVRRHRPDVVILKLRPSPSMPSRNWKKRASRSFPPPSPRL